MMIMRESGGAQGDRRRQGAEEGRQGEEEGGLAERGVAISTISHSRRSNNCQVKD